ncbi:Energy-coupling factor transporter transmembrane protein EcfT [uncultured archaeon]|nr:Energy-coupling factor transporter transmembrane protein EcfT [uncultured archaeon]
MHDLLDDYAQSNALRDINPRLKLFLGLCTILLCVSSTSPLAPLLVALTMGLITVTLAQIPGRFYGRLLLIPISFALISSVAIAFMHGTGQTLFSLGAFGYTISMREDGANLALLLISRTLGATGALFFIALTTPTIEIFATLKSLKVPESVIELSMMIYRYIFVFLDQAAMIHSAQMMRLGNAGLWNSLRSFAMLSCVLFLRSWEQGERLIVAMDARSYSGRLEIMVPPEAGAKPKAVLAVIAYLAAVAAISAITRDMLLL